MHALLVNSHAATMRSPWEKRLWSYLSKIQRKEMVHADDPLVGNAHAISISRRLHVHHLIQLKNCQVRFSLSSYWPLARQVHTVTGHSHPGLRARRWSAGPRGASSRAGDWPRQCVQERQLSTAGLEPIDRQRLFPSWGMTPTQASTHEWRRRHGAPP